MFAAESWKVELKRVFDALGATFNIRITSDCSCHVHVTPGTSIAAPFYTKEQLAKVACATCYWEAPLEQLLPPDRKQNEWAKRNTDAISELKRLYDAVPRNGWALVFRPFLNAPDLGTLAGLMWGDVRRIVRRPGAGPEATYYQKYLSTNFCNVLTEVGTVEFRRQGGVASAALASSQALLALTLHTSALRTDWSRLGSEKGYPTATALITELVQSMVLLPATCHSTKFEPWLRHCHSQNAGKRPQKPSPADIHRINLLQKKKRFEASQFGVGDDSPA
ncbi:hypothetical protein VTI74DRAFT_11255 [Chaetomium olivicolor]